MGRKSNYSAGVYGQLQEVMERLSVMESTHRQDHSEILRLNSMVKSQENELVTLRADGHLWRPPRPPLAVGPGHSPGH